MNFGTKLNSNELFVIRFHNIKITRVVDEDQTIFKNFVTKALLLDSRARGSQLSLVMLILVFS